MRRLYEDATITMLRLGILKLPVKLIRPQLVELSE